MPEKWRKMAIFGRFWPIFSPILSPKKCRFLRKFPKFCEIFKIAKSEIWQFLKDLLTADLSRLGELLNTQIFAHFWPFFGLFWTPQKSGLFWGSGRKIPKIANRPDFPEILRF